MSVRGIAQIALRQWRPGVVDLEAARRAIYLHVTDPDSGGMAVELLVGDLAAWPDLKAEEGLWDDEKPTTPAVPAMWTDLVRRAGYVQVVGRHDVVGGWVRLLRAAEEVAA